MSDVPYKEAYWAEPRVDMTHRADGAILMSSPYPLGEAPPNMVEPIKRWAKERPEHIFVAERGKDDAWETITYGEMKDRVWSLAEGLLKKGLGFAAEDQRPLVILSGNSIDHAVVTFAAMLVGAPAAPVSTSYSLVSTDHKKLKYIFELLEPAAVFVEEGARFSKALAAVDLKDTLVIHGSSAPEGVVSLALSELETGSPGPEVDACFDRLTYDTVAKLMFTSGSTGMPKAVINTHRMLCTNCVATDNLILTPNPEPPVIVSWLPWNHAMGAHSGLHAMLVKGGSYYIDDGAATEAGFAKTLRNLKEISPTTFSSVPAAYSYLVDELERDADLRKTFFAKLNFLSYGGAALSQDLADRLQKVSIKEQGLRMAFSSGYGATETSPLITRVTFNTDKTGLLGLPIPGAELKLAPVGEKMEVRVKGPFVTPGYYKRPDLTEAAFDEEGYYRLGDGARFLDPDNPLLGLVFDGRVVEDFKLNTGTWVSAGTLRLQAIAAADGLIRDGVITGLGRDEIGLMAWPNEEACRELLGDPEASLAEICAEPEVLEKLKERLKVHNQTHKSSSTRIARALLLVEPPSLDGGENTDKGYINQAAVLDRRAELVKKLYEDETAADIVVINKN